MNATATRLAKAVSLTVLAAVIGAGAGWLAPTLYGKIGTATTTATVRHGDYSRFFVNRDESLVLFTAAWCPVCRHTRNFLDQHGIAYTDMDIEADAGHAALYETLGVDVIPVIMTREKMLPGFDEDTISGWLTELRQTAPQQTGMSSIVGAARAPAIVSQ